MKKNQFGVPHHPGIAYRDFKRLLTDRDRSPSRAWKVAQNEFKRRKRKRKIARLSRKGRPIKRTLRPIVR